MMRKVSIHILRAVLAAGIVLGLSGVALRLRSGQALAATGNIDPVDKWAWGTNVGWINFRPEHGGVTVYPDHLEGTAWAENVGWIRLGTHTGGSPHTYDNASSTDYGVNNDGSGHLSGYAWGTNVGWINFSPTYGGVTVDPASGSFDGYAWGENIGWIHFKNTDPTYNVLTDWRNFYYYLPILFKSYVPPVPPPAAPDLVVDSLVATSTAVTVTIRNAGTTAVNDEFWVDVYFDPSETPSLNHPWNTIADHGVVWGVTTAIPVGGSLVLTTDASDPYYVPDYSSTPPLPVGAEVWALVDSVDPSTTYGAVQESDEGNNLYGPVTSTAATGEAAPVFRQSQPASREGLPPR
ncbi:MAG: hypothetical protein ACETWR_17560 [Anaerolineae bacterium]